MKNQIVIRVYLRLSRSNGRFSGVSRTTYHQELADVIGTGFIRGSILVFLAPLAVQYLFLVLSASWRFVFV